MILLEAFLEIIILMDFLAFPALHADVEYEVLELFGGAARTARLAKGINLKAASVDKAYHKSMDINSDAGFLLLGSVMTWGAWYTCMIDVCLVI